METAPPSVVPRLRAYANEAGSFVRRIPVPWWFVAAGAVTAVAVRVRGFDRAVHLGILAACAALLVIGSWVERFVLRLRAAGPAPVHSIAIGQAALIVYFYARSALSHAVGIPGTSPWELYLLAAGAGAHLLSGAPPRKEQPFRRSAGYAVVWVLWWTSLFIYLGYRSGRLETPSTDPDLHALFARLTAEHGWLIYDLLPQNPGPVQYPSGFSALNALWIDLSGASAVAIVNCQVALQACLAVGLVVESIFAIRDGPAPLASAGLIGLAHVVFSFPVHAALASLEGTPRLSHKALALLPLTLAARLASGDEQGAGALRAGIFVSCFAAAWSVAINPTHAFVELPILLGAALLFATSLRARPPHLARTVVIASVASVAIGALILFSDAWLRSLLHGSSAVPGGTVPSLALRAAVLQGFRRAGSVSFLSIIPSSCIPSVQCSEFAAALGRALCSPLVLIALFALVAARRYSVGPRMTRAAVVVLAVASCLWATAFLADFIPTAFSAVPGQVSELLRGYTHTGLLSSSALLSFTLLGVAIAFAGEIARALARRYRLADHLVAEGASAAALAIAAGALVVHRPDWPREISRAYSQNVKAAPLSSVGNVLPEDVRLARKAASLVPAGEKVLLPGVVLRANQWEYWYFTVGGSRAIPFYTDIPFAFFHHTGNMGSTIADYREHVCERLDLSWLAEHRILWVYDSAQVADLACVHGWRAAREKYFDLELRDGNASLWRLRTDLLGQANRDPVLTR